MPRSQSAFSYLMPILDNTGYIPTPIANRSTVECISRGNTVGGGVEISMLLSAARYQRYRISNPFCY